MALQQDCKNSEDSHSGKPFTAPDEVVSAGKISCTSFGRTRLRIGTQLLEETKLKKKQQNILFKYITKLLFQNKILYKRLNSV